MDIIKRKFIEHKYAARRRGIEFHFTFEEWVKWWESNLGPNWITLRGRNAGQYVMARNGDIGNYEFKNVKCVTCEVNNRGSIGSRQVEKHWKAKLTEANVFDIRSSKLRSGALAVKYKVHRVTINRIRRKENWGHI